MAATCPLRTMSVMDASPRLCWGCRETRSAWHPGHHRRARTPAPAWRSTATGRQSRGVRVTWVAPGGCTEALSFASPGRECPSARLRARVARRVSGPPASASPSTERHSSRACPFRSQGRGSQSPKVVVREMRPETWDSDGCTVSRGGARFRSRPVRCISFARTIERRRVGCPSKPCVRASSKR